MKFTSIAILCASFTAQSTYSFAFTPKLTTFAFQYRSSYDITTSSEGSYEYGRSSLSMSSSKSKYGKDTAAELPPFETQEEYTNYLMEASALPQGFSVGSAVGEFIPEEAPSMGSLPIKGTIIHLTDGPTDSWAAVFTQNKVSGLKLGVGECEV